MPSKPYHLLTPDEKDQVKKYVNENRRKKKIQAVEYKGGCCRICKYKRCMDALQFHHLDPSEKDFSINRAGTWAWVRLIKELDKCVLLCNRCHTEVHAGVVDLRDYLTAEEIERAAKASKDNGPNILEFFT